MTRDPEPPAEPTPLTQLLLVEDEASLRSLLARFLERAGYAVTSAGDGEAALSAFAPAPERFVAVVLDLTLPDMSGDTLLARLRESRPALPVVVCSGTARSRAEFAGSGPVCFLQKPFLPAKLVEALAELLPRQSSSESSAS